jgi:histidine triad (HIT) family protein
MAEYDNSNIFAKILRGELPAQKVYEDEHTLGFLDIMPRAPGHTLIIPKRPARNLLDIEPESLAHVIKTAKKIAIAGKKAFNADGITMQQFNETAGGQVVFHLHVHIIPRHTGVQMKPAASVMEKPEVLAEHAKLLKEALA